MECCRKGLKFYIVLKRWNVAEDLWYLLGAMKPTETDAQAAPWVTREVRPDRELCPRVELQEESMLVDTKMQH